MVEVVGYLIIIGSLALLFSLGGNDGPSDSVGNNGFEG